MLHLPAIAFILFAGVSLSPAALISGEPPDTTLERRVTAYVDAFNSGDTTRIRNFLENNFTPEMLTRVPIARRLDRFMGMRDMLGSLTIQGIRETSPGSITAIMTSSLKGRLTFTFEAENGPPFRMTGVRVERPEGPGEDRATPAPDEAGLIAMTGALLDSLIREGRFSGAVLIARNDSILLERAAGFADREKRIPNTLETRFNVGSINKHFTRLAISQLQAAGKLSFGDTIGKFLPDYPNTEAASTVTIDHLLEMTSGTPDFFGDRFEQARKEDIRTLRDYLPLFADKPLEFAPGSATRYSNGGYLVLGVIIEAITGMDYFTYVRDSIFTPAGMNASGWYERSDPREDLARGYTSGGKTPNFDLLPQKGSSAGGGYSTVHDLLRYTHALRTGTLVLPGSEDGLGIAGGAPGLNAALEMDPSSGYVIVVLSNLDPPSAESVARTIRLSLPRN